MNSTLDKLDALYNLCHIPMALFGPERTMLRSWPQAPEGVYPFAYHAVIEDFHLQKRDMLHPLLNLIDPGFLLGIMELAGGQHLMIGLVPAFALNRTEILSMLANVVQPNHLHTFCDNLLRLSPMALEQMKDYMCLAAPLLLQKEISRDNILLMDILSEQSKNPVLTENDLFRFRENPELHIPIDFETGICNAITAGDRVQLARSLYAPHSGRVGLMSPNELRQNQYAFICMITLASRAAILGGLPSETVFSLSDLYCQRVDLMNKIDRIQNLTQTMLIDFCDRVHEIRKQPMVSPVIEKCLSYISVHLHEGITLEQLSRHCGLCGRSLSLRFKKEVGTGITDYIHRERIQEAQYLLLHSNYSISEIASFLNYPSQSYFTHIFRQIHNQTPMQYRNAQKHYPLVRD